VPSSITPQHPPQLAKAEAYAMVQPAHPRRAWRGSICSVQREHTAVYMAAIAQQA